MKKTAPLPAEVPGGPISGFLALWLHFWRRTCGRNSEPQQAAKELGKSMVFCLEGWTCTAMIYMIYYSSTVISHSVLYIGLLLIIPKMV